MLFRSILRRHNTPSLWLLFQVEHIASVLSLVYVDKRLVPESSCLVDTSILLGWFFKAQPAHGEDGLRKVSRQRTPPFL